MIALDGYGYDVAGAGYTDAPSTFAGYARTLTGAQSIVESGVYEQAYQLQLDVAQWQYELLKASFVKCHSTVVYLDFIDARGVNFDPAAGSDTPTHKFATGVWFESLSEPKPTDLLLGPLNQSAPLPYRRFVATVKLIVASKVLV